MSQTEGPIKRTMCSEPQHHIPQTVCRKITCMHVYTDTWKRKLPQDFMESNLLWFIEFCRYLFFSSLKMSHNFSVRLKSGLNCITSILFIFSCAFIWCCAWDHSSVAWQSGPSISWQLISTWVSAVQRTLSCGLFRCYFANPSCALMQETFSWQPF